MQPFFVGSLVVNEQGQLVFMTSADLKEANRAVRKRLFEACGMLFAQALTAEIEAEQPKAEAPRDAGGLPSDVEPA